jgi:CheY-like chemotaxis protein
MSAVLMKPRKASELDRRKNRHHLRRPARARGDMDGTTPINLARHRLRVLIIDDHRDAADALAMLVSAWGHDVMRAYDGAAGLALASTYQPDVLLLDIVMPEMSGVDLAPRMRQQAGLHNCLMIAITGRADATTRSQCENAGIDLFLIKPVDHANLQTLLALESNYRCRLQCDVQKVAAAPAIGVQRSEASSSRRTRLSFDVLQGTVAS